MSSRLVLLAVGMVVWCACGDDPPAPPAPLGSDSGSIVWPRTDAGRRMDGGTDGGTARDGATDAGSVDATRDGSVDGDADAGLTECNAVVPSEVRVDSVASTGSVPRAQWGLPVDGRYILTEARTYGVATEETAAALEVVRSGLAAELRLYVIDYLNEATPRRYNVRFELNESAELPPVRRTFTCDDSGATAVGDTAPYGFTITDLGVLLIRNPGGATGAVEVFEAQ